MTQTRSASENPAVRMDEQQLTEARAWIAECSWADLDESGLEELTDAEVERGIARHYEGGIEQFIADGR